MSQILYLIVSSLLVILGSLLIWVRRKNAGEKSICIVVLGDLGRSPRMQYHAISFLNEGFVVDLVSHSGSTPLQSLTDNQSVRIHYLKPLPQWNNEMPRLLSYVIKTIWQSVDLFTVLLRNIRSSHLMLQNPPAIPTIPVCWLFCRISSTQFIVDWHNYAHSIMALSVGSQHFLVKATKLVESYFGGKADKNFCVSCAMKDDLNEKWSIKASVLYDRPPKEFRPISLEEKHSLMLKLSKMYEEFGDGDETSVFTEKLPNGEFQLKKIRPALIVSSTSWTEDEDFSILLTALKEYEIACCAENSKFPNLICAITGKGPLKEFWNAIIKLKKWKHVKIVTPWLENEDYPKLLASADLGVCLHTSSSGLDLPMKVVDMFGCELPVCAYKFQSLKELVKHEKNSLEFSNDKELTQQLKDWFNNFPNNEEQIQREKQFREELKKFHQIRWHDSQKENQRPIVGILTQEISYRLNEIYPNQYDSYIAASYVKFIESAGARVVPIWIGESDSYYEDILHKINGVVFPGGSTFFNQSNGYADAGRVIYRIATKMNKDGDYFPIWGICLGFELLTYLAANGVEHRSNCNSKNQVLPLVFKSDYSYSRMFENAPNDIIEILTTERVTANFHKFCVTENDLKKVDLDHMFRVISVNQDLNGLEFISTIEHIDMPFYGIQFHPEKNNYEWAEKLKIPHSLNAVRISQFFSNKIVQQARKNHHSFPPGQEEEHLIYNFNVTFTGPKSSFMQCYLFKKKNII